MKKVLIVDDTENIRKTLGDEFSRLGQKVSETSSVNEALSKILDESFDYAVIDLKLGFESKFGGLEVLKELTKNQPNCKFVIISAYVMDDLEEMLLNELPEQTVQEIVKTIEDNYVCKIEEQNYINAVIDKLGFEYQTSPWSGDYYASFFPASKYIDPEIPDLHYPLKDAKRLSKILTEYYSFKYENISLYNNPNRKDIINDLHVKSLNLKSDDNYLIFLAGHGVWDERRSRGYFLTSNSYKETPSEWLSYGEIADYIRGIKSRHTLVICDACYSGSIFKPPERRVSPNLTVARKYSIKSRTGISSGDPEQAVPDKSTFLDYLIKSLEENRSGYLLGINLYNKIIEEFEKNNQSLQNPVHGIIQDAGDEIGGDFVFVKDNGILNFFT